MMVSEKSASVPESMAYLAFILSLLRPDLQAQIKLDQPSINPMTIGSNPFNLTGLAFSETNLNRVDNFFTSKETLTEASNYDPLSQYLNWQPNAQFNSSAVAMILGESNPRGHLGSLDSESGYSSDDAKGSPLSTASYNHSEDLSEFGAAGYTPPSDLAELLNSFEDYVDIDSWQNTEPSKGILDAQDFNQFDLSGFNVKQEPNFYPNKLSPQENFLYSPEYKTSPEGNDFQDPYNLELENKYFDPFTIDFGNTLTNSSSQFGSELETEIDLDSLASLDFGLPLDILNPLQEIDTSETERQLNQLIQGPVTTKDNVEFHPTVSSTSVINDDRVTSAPQVPTSDIDTLSSFQRSGLNEVKRISSSSKKITATKSKSLKIDDLLGGVSETKIIEMAVSEFNLFLEKLSEEQAKYVRDVRRRGKNKEAARVCRKRKIDAIDDIDEELQRMKDEKKRVLEERNAIREETATLKSKIKELENSVFNSLRDERGQPLSSFEYSIFQGSNGAVYVGKTIAEKEKKQERS